MRSRSWPWSPSRTAGCPTAGLWRRSVRRAACHLGGQQVFVELELLRAAPHIDAVQRHIDGKVADDADFLLVGVVLQRLPLTVEHKLYSLPERHIVGVLLPGCCQGSGLTAPQRFFPFQPADSVVGVLQRHEQRVVGQPEVVFLHKAAVVGTGLCQQTFGSTAQHCERFSYMTP